MYVLGSYNGSDGTFPSTDKDLKNVRDDAAATDLSAVGWGVLYPDLLRTVPGLGSIAGLIVGHNVDRGWALENQWIKNWDGHLWIKPPNISDWAEDTRRGMRPAVIFNVTASETGQRMVVGSSSLPDGPDKLKFASSALQFAKAYPGLDIPVSTAARLSASFSWVSPMSRSERKGDDFMHFADGGYFDNSGLLSASDWLLAVKDEIKDRQVLLIVIDATESERSKHVAWSWQRQFVAPIATLNSVRSGSQQSRSDFELPLVSAFLGDKKLSVFPFEYPHDRLAPLSWHLTPQQQLSIGEAWSDGSAELDGTRRDLYAQLQCPVPSRR
jgi:hypothetical protein